MPTVPGRPAPGGYERGEVAGEGTRHQIRKEAERESGEQALAALREAIAEKMSRRYGLPTEVENVIVTDGATEAIYAAVQGVVDPGDEVIIFEPFYDSYVPSVEFAGGVPR